MKIQRALLMLTMVNLTKPSVLHRSGSLFGNVPDDLFECTVGLISLSVSERSCPDASKSLLRVSASVPHRQDGAACAAHDFIRSSDGMWEAVAGWVE